MATYVNNLRLTEITTGDEDGTWGTTTNTNWDFATDAFGYGVKNMAGDADQTFTMADGSVDTLRSMYLKITSTVAPLTATRTLTIAPNTVSKVWIIENNTAGSQSIIIKQGSGADVTIATGTKVMVYSDGAGAGAAVISANPSAAASGTVTSVAASVPTLLSVSGSPITSSGTLAFTYSGTALPVANGGTALTTGTSGGVLAYTASGTLASSAALTQYGVVYGGGAGAVPVATAAGTNGQVLTATTAGAPSWAAPATGGTVTSVAASVPSIFSISGSPITSSGTLAMTYSGTALPAANGGTGVANNAASTLTISGAFATTLTVSGATGVTLPTTGTLATLAGSETFTNKTLTSPTLTTPALGTPASGTLSSCTVDGTNLVGFLNIPQNSQSTAYTLVLADAGKHIFHPSTDANARTYTIPANSSVAYTIGTAITFINMTSQVVTIAITTDTMYLSSAGTTGSRSLAQYGSATAIKMTSTTWLISGSGLT